MAPKKTNKPGRSTRYYRKSSESYKKKLAYDRAYNKSAKRRKYRAELKIERRKRGLDGKGGPDLSHTKDGRLVLEDPKTNRARNRSKK